MAKKVLIIDDDPVIRTLLGDLLSSQGVQVWSCETGAEGLTMLADKQPDLVFLDYQLPDRSGVEILKEIRNDAATQGTKVVLFSASNDTKKDAEKAGTSADWYLKKPFELREIVEILQGLN